MRPFHGFLRPVLILALLATPLAPLRTSWACSDGTQCVLDSSRRFVCPGGACSTGASCCRIKQTVACKHGAFPGLDSTHGADQDDEGVESPDHCRFSMSKAPKVVAKIGSQALFVPGAVALPVSGGPELQLPGFPPVWRLEYSLGYRPPPLLRSGPGRAPPTQ